MGKRAKRASADALAFGRVAVPPQKVSEFFALKEVRKSPMEARESPIRQWKSPMEARESPIKTRESPVNPRKASAVADSDICQIAST